jgi:hypothetical protein
MRIYPVSLHPFHLMKIGEAKLRCVLSAKKKEVIAAGMKHSESIRNLKCLKLHQQVISKVLTSIPDTDIPRGA